MFGEGYYLTVEQRGDENVTSYFFLYNHARAGSIFEVVSVGSETWGELGGITLEEVYDAYNSTSRVVVRGNAFVLSREGKEYQCIDVEGIEILNRKNTPLIVYLWNSSDGFPFHPGGRVSFYGWYDSLFTYVRGIPRANYTEYFRVLLDEGESIRFVANSTHPVSMKVFASLGSNATIFRRVLGEVLFEYHNVTGINREFSSVGRGDYTFHFFLEYPTTKNVKVDFKVGRVR